MIELVVAGPGSGKTTWIINDIRNTSVPTLAMTFSRKAAKELLTRSMTTNNVHISTIHSLAYKIVKENKKIPLIDDEYTFDHLMLDAVELADQYAGRWERIYVDEAQDIDRIQLEFLLRIGKKSRLIFVGDMDQTIYSWRGSLDNLFNILQPDEVRHLDRTYRLPSNIYEVAWNVISKIPYKYRRKLKPVREGGIVRIHNFKNDEEEFEYIKTHIDDKSAVLFRTNERIYRFTQLTGMPRRVSINEFTSVLRAFKLLLQCVPYDDMPIENHKRVFRRLKQLDNNRAITLIERLLYLSGRYIPEEIEIVAETLRREELTLVDLLAGVDVPVFPNPQVMTMHASKGLEFNKVFVEFNDILNPLDEPEERRLFYVAITRAREELHVAGVNMLSFGVKRIYGLKEEANETSRS